MNGSCPSERWDCPLWDPPRPADHLELVGHDGPRLRVAFSPTPDSASVRRTEAKVRLWDPRPDLTSATASARANGGLRPGWVARHDRWDRSITRGTVPAGRHDSHRPPPAGRTRCSSWRRVQLDGSGWRRPAGTYSRASRTACGSGTRHRQGSAVFQPPVGRGGSLSPDGRSLAVGGLREAVAVRPGQRERPVPARGLVRAVFAPNG